MSLKFTGEFCIITMKNDAIFEEELTHQFKIGINLKMYRVVMCDGTEY